jgi:hypothetical protein
MPRQLTGWEHDPDGLRDADRATSERAARPGRPVVLAMCSQTGALGRPYSQAFASLGEAFVRAEGAWERSGHATAPLWISDGLGRNLPLQI